MELNKLGFGIVRQYVSEGDQEPQGQEQSVWSLDFNAGSIECCYNC